MFIISSNTRNNSILIFLHKIWFSTKLSIVLTALQPIILAMRTSSFSYLTTSGIKFCREILGSCISANSDKFWLIALTLFLYPHSIISLIQSINTNQPTSFFQISHPISFTLTQPYLGKSYSINIIAQTSNTNLHLWITMCPLSKLFSCLTVKFWQLICFLLQNKSNREKFLSSSIIRSLWSY